MLIDRRKYNINYKKSRKRIDRLILNINRIITELKLKVKYSLSLSTGDHPKSNSQVFMLVIGISEF